MYQVSFDSRQTIYAAIFAGMSKHISSSDAYKQVDIFFMSIDKHDQSVVAKRKNCRIDCREFILNIFVLIVDYLSDSIQRYVISNADRFEVI